MTDYFALLGVPARPVVDGGAVKESYLRLAAQSHPDAGGDEGKFRVIQEAYRKLSEPAARLRHLAEMRGGGSNGAMDPRISDLFMKVGGVMQQARALLARSGTEQGALARALGAQDRARVLGEVRAEKSAVATLKDAILRELDSLDARWPEVQSGELENFSSSFRYLDRWLAELGEMEFQLEHGEVAR